MGRGLNCLLVAALGFFIALPAVHAQDSPHGALSVSCDACHNTDSWKVSASAMRFDHSTTGFPLDGRHVQVACRQCHTTLRFTGTSENCSSCHEDVHRQELGTMCERCHAPTSWLVPDMTQRHISTRFALLGAHRLAQCQSCHTNQEKHTYAGVPLECYNCHGPDYEATVAPPHRASGIGTDCVSCHSVSALTWGGRFDHTQTGFALVGAHATVPCVGCHEGKNYTGLSDQCASCHLQAYNATTNPAHATSGFPTTCEDCHGSAAWVPSGFKHTSFPLTGAHATVQCTGCHSGGTYTGLSEQCSSCHLQQYNATTNPAHATSGFPTTCESCHGTATWVPSTFQHDSFFPISAGSTHRPGRWNACSDCHTSAGSMQQFSCLNCHEHAQTNVDPRHTGVSGYRYESQACYSCHPRGRE